jgi:hypothetical protein
MLMTPTLLDAADPAAAGACAPAAAVLKMHAAARATVRVNTFRDRDRVGVNNLEFTFFSLLWSATENRGEPAPSQLGLKLIPLPAGITSALQTSKYSRRGLLAAIRKQDCPASPGSETVPASRTLAVHRLFYFGNGNRITRLLA